MVYCASHERRHPVWPVYGSPTYSPAPRSSWIARAEPSRSFSRWCRLARPRSATIWRRGASMANPAPPASLPSIRTALYPRRKTYSLQVVQGRLFGMGQSKANQGIHVLLPALLAALRTLGEAPGPLPHGPRPALRGLGSRRRRRRVGGGPAPSVAAPVAPPFAHDGTERRIVRPRTLLHRRHVIAARKRTTPSKMSCS